MTTQEINTLVAAGAVRAVRRSRDGRVTEYEITHLGRVLLGRVGLAEGVELAHLLSGGAK